MRSMQNTIFIKILLVSIALAVSTNAVRIYFEKCEYKGFTCVKSTKVVGRHDITFTCNSISTWDVEFYLWSFRALNTITTFTIANCSNLTLNLQCTNEGKPIQSLRVSNITKLTIPSLLHGLTHTPPIFILEDIQDMDTITTRTFIQIKKFQYGRYACVNPVKDLEHIEFRNVKIDSIDREAFHNLTNVKNFTFDNVTVNKISDSAIHVFLDKDAGFQVSRSNITIMEFMSFHVRGSKLMFQSNTVKDMHTTSIKTTIYDLDFHNNSIGWMHCGAMSVLAQNVRITDSSFDYLGSGAFQGIGPGLPENALIGFGSLKFTYEFKNNLVESLEVGSLHPDWRAYKNVGGNLVLTYNSLKCTCAELAWLGAKEGYGRDYSSLDEFHENILKREHNNLCIDAPCLLPVDAVRLMVIKDGRCLHNVTKTDLCNIYYPQTTISTKKPYLKFVPTTPYLQFFKRSRIGVKSNAAKHIKFNIGYMFILLLLVTYYF